jgi:hypothetical protein
MVVGSVQLLCEIVGAMKEVVNMIEEVVVVKELR